MWLHVYSDLYAANYIIFLFLFMKLAYRSQSNFGFLNAEELLVLDLFRLITKELFTCFVRMLHNARIKQNHNSTIMKIA